MSGYDAPLGVTIGVASAVGFTIFQIATLQSDMRPSTFRFWRVMGLNLFAAYLTWLNYRSIDHGSVELQLFLGFGRAFVSWLSFAIVSQKQQGSLTKQQFAGFLASIGLTMLTELNKRLTMR